MSIATCFNGHDLKQRVNDNTLSYCDMCGETLVSNVPSYSCIPCDFNVCKTCIGHVTSSYNGSVTCGHNLVITGTLAGAQTMANRTTSAECAECSALIRGEHYTCDMCEYVICNACIYVVNTAAKLFDTRLDILTRPVAESMNGHGGSGTKGLKQWP
jgi:hypothetical protein